MFIFVSIVYNDKQRRDFKQKGIKYFRKIQSTKK